MKKHLFVITVLWFVMVFPYIAYSAEVIIFNSSWGIVSSNPFRCSIGPKVFNPIQNKQYLKFSLEPGKYQIACTYEQQGDIRFGIDLTKTNFEVKQDPVYIQIQRHIYLVISSHTLKQVLSLPDGFFLKYQEIK